VLYRARAGAQAGATGMGARREADGRRQVAGGEQGHGLPAGRYDLPPAKAELAGE
jgi:hypothetical protein